MATHIGFAEGHESNGTGRTTLSTSTSLTLAVGDCVHVHLGFEATSVSGVSITGISDGLVGNTYTQVERENHSSQTDMASAHFECIVATAGTATFTATWGSNVTYCHIEAFQGRPDSGKAFQSDVSTSGQSSTQGTAATAAGVAVDAPGYMSAGVKSYSDGNWSSTWGTELGALTAVNFAGAYLLTSVDQTETPEITTSNGTSWCIGAIHTKEVSASATLTADAGTFTLTGQAAEFSKNLGSATDIGGLVIGSETSFVGEGYVGANEAPAGGSPYTMVASAGSFTLSGQAATLQWDQTLVAAAGSFTLSGQAATLRRGISMVAAAGSFSLTGQAATTRQGYVLTAAAGAFTLTGSDAARDLAMSAAAGSFTLTGQDATLTYTPAGADPVLTADAGSFTLTGQAATLRFGHVMPAAAGSFSLTGQAATLRAARVLTAAAGTFSLTGQDATMTPSGAPAVLTADAGSFTLTGQAATLRAARQMVSAAGSFTLNGQAATLLTAHQLVAAAGSFTLTGQDATLTPDVAAVLTAESGTFTLTGYAADLIAPSTIVSGVGGGGGGGGIWYQDQKPRRKRKTLGDLANQLIDETLAETLYRDIKAAGEGEAVAKAVKPHAEAPRAAIPPPEAVDWEALTRDATAVGALLQTWRRIEREREIADDDEDWLLM